jgi:hypothetical protein
MFIPITLEQRQAIAELLNVDITVLDREGILSEPADMTDQLKQWFADGVGANPSVEQLWERVAEFNLVRRSLAHPALFGRKITSSGKSVGFEYNDPILRDMAYKICQSYSSSQKHIEELSQYFMVNQHCDPLKAKLMAYSYNRVKFLVFKAICSYGVEEMRNAMTHSIADLVKMLFPNGYSTHPDSLTITITMTSAFEDVAINELFNNYAEYITNYTLEQASTDEHGALASEDLEVFENSFAEKFNDALPQAIQVLTADMPFTIGSLRGDYHLTRISRAFEDHKTQIPGVSRIGVHLRQGVEGNQDYNELVKVESVHGPTQWVAPLGDWTGFFIPYNPDTDNSGYYRASTTMLPELMGERLSDIFYEALPQNLELPDELTLPLLVNHHGGHWTGAAITISLDPLFKQFLSERAGHFRPQLGSETSAQNRENQEQLQIMLSRAHIRVAQLNSSPLYQKYTDPHGQDFIYRTESSCEAELRISVDLAKNGYNNLVLPFQNMTYECVPVAMQRGTTCMEHSLLNSLLYPLVENMPSYRPVRNHGEHDVSYNERYQEVLLKLSEQLRKISDTSSYLERSELVREFIRNMPALQNRLEGQVSGSATPEAPESAPRKAVSKPAVAKPTSPKPVVTDPVVNPAPEPISEPAPAPRPAPRPSVTEPAPGVPSVSKPEKTKKPTRKQVPVASHSKRKANKQLSSIRSKNTSRIAALLAAFRDKTQRIFGQKVSNGAWGVLTFMLMIFTLGIVSKPYKNHRRANELNEFLKEDSSRAKIALGSRWSNVTKASGMLNDAALLDENVDPKEVVYQPAVTLPHLLGLATRSIPLNETVKDTMPTSSLRP